MIYNYDQSLRLKTIEKIVTQEVSGRSRALDYGCGTGDFTSMLAKSFDQVIRAEIAPEIVDAATQQNFMENIEYQCIDDTLYEKPYDLILSITVMQHILDDTDLSNLLFKFENCLHLEGRLIILESFAATPAEASINQYLRVRLLDEFIELAKQSNLVLDKSYNFYHPTQKPTGRFLTYLADPFVVGSFVGEKFGKSIFQGYVKQKAKLFSQMDSAIIKQDSNSKLLIFKKNTTT